MVILNIVTILCSRPNISLRLRAGSEKRFRFMQKKSTCLASKVYYNYCLLIKSVLPIYLYSLTVYNTSRRYIKISHADHILN